MWGCIFVRIAYCLINENGWTNFQISAIGAPNCAMRRSKWTNQVFEAKKTNLHEKLSRFFHLCRYFVAGLSTQKTVMMEL